MRRQLPTPHGQRAQIYRNLHCKCLSVMEKGRVSGHADVVFLENVKFSVRETGRQKVIKEQRKNVHAFAIGNLASCSNDNLPARENLVPITYNPYFTDSFYRKDNGQPVKSADYAIITTYGIFAHNCAA